VLGVLLDILIRDRTGDERSLDDVLRAMNTEFAKQGRFYRDSLDVRLTAEKIAGGSFDEFFRKYVASAEPLPYQQVLPLAGLQLQILENRRPTLSFSAARDWNGPVVVEAIDAEGAAAEAGLRLGDVILNWNGSEVPRNPEVWLYSQKKGSNLRLGIRRDRKNLTLEFRLGETTETLYRPVEDSNASEKARRIREGLLRGTTQPVTASIP
jgi:predicted metalloprotease with PDZ domain